MKTYVLCTSLEEESVNTLKKLKGDIEITDANIHVITVIEKQIYTVDLAAYVYPIEAQYPSIEASALGILKTIGQSLGVEEKNLTCKCFIDYDRDKIVKQYLESIKADLVIVATRGKHGLDGFFSSSFTDYLCKFSPCDVLVMRPRK